MKGYKGFNPGLICKGKQYRENTVLAGERSGLYMEQIRVIREMREHPGKEIWKLLIRWEWLPGVVVPYNTDGKIRCERAELVEVVEE